MTTTTRAAAALVQSRGAPMPEGEAAQLHRARLYLDALRTVTDRQGRQWRVVGRCYDPKAECEIVTLRSVGNGELRLIRGDRFRVGGEVGE